MTKLYHSFTNHSLFTRKCGEPTNGTGSYVKEAEGKREEVYLHDYQMVADAVSGLKRYFQFYSHERPHQALGYRTPARVFSTAS